MPRITGAVACPFNPTPWRKTRCPPYQPPTDSSNAPAPSSSSTASTATPFGPSGPPLANGFRKPHFIYSLTREAERLFPKAYDALLNRLIGVLKQRLSGDDLEELLREVGRSLAAATPSAAGDDLQTRVRSALKVLESIGGVAEAGQEGDKVVIHSGGCPLAAAVSAHPEVCRLAESLISDIVKSSVKEHCDREGEPHCRFEIDI